MFVIFWWEGTSSCHIAMCNQWFHGGAQQWRLSEKNLQKVTEFNTQLDSMGSEMVAYINAKPNCHILQAHGYDLL